MRRELGVLRAWASLFERSVAAGLRPWRGRDVNVFASTGYVGAEASEYWGSNQAAAALSIWSRTSRVRHYPDTYNVPLHLRMDGQLTGALSGPPVHVHYHWTFAGDRAREVLPLLRALGTADDRLEWLRQRLPLEPGRLTV
ncbi:MAG: hypothetical protein R2712_28865 [Vicinamibacterales bacterium]